MKNGADYKYYYVIEAPYKGIDEYVCIPWTWIVSRTEANVVVSYPVENPSVTEQCVKDIERISKEWKSYKSIVRIACNTYNEAKLTATKMNKLHHQQSCSIKECGVCGDYETWGSVKKTTHRSKRGAHSKQNKDKPLEFAKSSKKDDRTATKTRLKRTPQSNPETEAALKWSKVVEPEQLCHVFQCPNENSSLEPITIADPELFTVIFTLLRDLQKSSTTNHSVLDIVLKTLIVNDKVMKEQAKLIVELRAALASKGTTAVVEKISKKNKKKRKEQDDDHKVIKKRYHKPKIVLPPEYNENDSRWTLKHRELASGLVELMPHTSVYINAVQLLHCKRLTKNCRSLARLLALEIFTKNALSVCSLTGSRARAYDVNGAFVRPGLDENARLAILDFVEEYRREKGWKIQEQQSTLIKNGIRSLMKQFRVRYG